MPYERITEVPNPINYTDVNKIFRNQAYLADILTADNIIANITEMTTHYTDKYSQMKTIYNTIQSNLDSLNDNKYRSGYYGQAVTHTKYEPNYEDWERIIKCLNDLDDMLSQVKTKWGYLKCTDGYPTINNQKLLIRE